MGNWKKWSAIKGNDYDSLTSKNKLSVMYYGDTDHSNFAGGRGILQLTAAGYGGNQNTEREIKEAAEQLNLDPLSNSNDFYNSTLLTLQAYKNRGHDFSTYDSAQSARKGAVNPYEKYHKLPDHKKDTLLKYANLENNSSVNPEVIANSNMLSPEQKQRMMASNDSGRGVPNNVANNLSNETQTSSAPSTFSQAMNFTGGVSPDVQQSLDELSMETDGAYINKSATLTPKQYAKGGELNTTPRVPIYEMSAAERIQIKNSRRAEKLRTKAQNGDLKLPDETVNQYTRRLARKNRLSKHRDTPEYKQTINSYRKGGCLIK